MIQTKSGCHVRHVLSLDEEKGTAVVKGYKDTPAREMKIRDLMQVSFLNEKKMTLIEELRERRDRFAAQ